MGVSADRRNTRGSIFSERDDYTWKDDDKKSHTGIAVRYDESSPDGRSYATATDDRTHEDSSDHAVEGRHSRKADDHNCGIQKAQSTQGIFVRGEKRNMAAGGGSRPAGKIIYRVRKGDTLYRISRRFGCSVAHLARINTIDKRGGIRAGMVLRIPTSGKKSAGGEDGDVRQDYRTGVDFSWPLRKVIDVSRDTGTAARTGGIIVKGSPGAEVLSAADGAVEKIGEMRGYGTYVILSHQGRYVSVYARLKGVAVREGERVASGMSIARTSDDDGEIIFEIGRSGRPVDPLRLLPKRSGMALSSN